MNLNVVLTLPPLLSLESVCCFAVIIIAKMKSVTNLIFCGTHIHILHPCCAHVMIQTLDGMCSHSDRKKSVKMKVQTSSDPCEKSSKLGNLHFFREKKKHQMLFIE